MPKNSSIDLHVHSHYSDGRLSPEELARRAVGRNVVALAITDHDTLDGAEDKLDACRRNGIECVTGVELSCELGGREAHILSLFAVPDPRWVERMEEFRAAREARMVKMLERLAGLGIVIGLDELEVGDGGNFGRPHLARALVAKGVVKSVNEAFARYLYDDGPVYIPKMRLTAEEGIDFAKRMGGVAILAHPGVSGHVDKLDEFARLGIDGVEAHHPKHGGETTAKILRFCAERDLLPSGGSDFHCPGDSPDIGSASTPVDLLGPLRERAERRKNALASE